MIDVLGLPAVTPTAQDFDVSVGGGTSWAAGPAPSISVRRSAGNGGDRITLSWPDGAIRNTWLRVTVKATANTGLPQPDVFYFGNLAGDTGNDRGAPVVNATDLARVRRDLGRTTPAALAASDFNRDGKVNATDLAVARTNEHRALPLFAAPAPAAPAAATPAPLLRTTPRRGVWQAADPDAEK
jgi:hypothetical protein